MRRLGCLVAALAVALLPAAAGAASDGGVAGTVRGAGGRPLAGAVVTVVETGCAAGARGCPEPAHTASGGDGAWRVAPLAPGDYHVHVADPSGAHADAWWDGDTEPADVVTVPDGGDRDGVDFDLAPSARIRGRVVDGDGRAVAGATVTAARTPFSVARDETGPQGGFTLDGLAGRTYEVAASPAGAGLEAGTAGVTVAGGATAEVEFVLALRRVELTRLSGDTRVTTAVAASRHAFERSEHVVLAAAESFPDALAAAPLAAGLDAPLLLTGATLDARVAAEVERLEAREVVIVGAVAAVPLAVQEDLRALGVEVRRLPGETRFDTAALIARSVGAPGGEAVVASGVDFPDALSVAPLAAAHGLPILLTPRGTPVRDTVEALAALEVDSTLVVGGAAAVSGEVAASLPSVTRLAGPERYATSVAVAGELARRGGDLAVVSVATGREFPDALAAGPVAARGGGPVLLVDGSSAGGAPASVEFLAEHRADVGALWVFGGTAAISEAVAASLRDTAGAP